MQVEVSPGETVDFGLPVSYCDNPCLCLEARLSLHPARWLVAGRGRCAPSASGFQLRRPSPGFCGLSLFKFMNHRGARGKSFYRNEHVVSVPAELFWGQKMGKMQRAVPSCLGQALLLGDEGSGSNSCLVSHIKITFPDTVTKN